MNNWVMKIEHSDRNICDKFIKFIDERTFLPD